MMQPLSQLELKDLLAEASLALARLDAERLEEMALSCAALVCDVDVRLCPAKSKQVEAMQEMAIFARVLDAAKANLKVMHRLREVRAAQLEYSPAKADIGVSEES